MQRQDQPVTKPDFGWNKNRSFLVKAVNDKDNDGCREMVQFLVLMRFHWLAGEWQKISQTKFFFVWSHKKCWFWREEKGSEKMTPASVDRFCWLAENEIPWMLTLIFKKAATTWVDLLFIELLSHLSHVKQMYIQPIHLTHELILFIQITRGRLHFNRYSAVKSSCWHRALNLWCSNPDLLWFAPVPSS